MNLSTDAPTQPVQFQFDPRFGEKEESPDPMPILEEEWRNKADDCRDEGYRQGRAEGVEAGKAEALQSQEAQIASCLKRLCDQTDLLFSSHDQVAKELECAAARLAVQAGKSMAGSAMEKFPLAHVEDMLVQAMAETRGNAVLSASVAPDLVEPLNQRLSDLGLCERLAGRIDIIPDPNLETGAACVAWEGSGLEYDQARVLDALEQNLTDLLGPMDGPDTVGDEEQG